MEILTSRDGATISYDKYGSGPPLVLVHGSMSDHQTSWEAVKGPLSQRFTLYAMDRRGRGQTTAPQERRLEDEFGDVAGLLQAIGEPSFVMGHSYGAHCALGGAAEQPGLVSKLVLYEPPRPDAMSAGEIAKVEEAASQGDWDRFVRTWLIDVVEIPAQVADALHASPFWPLMIADAPATLCDARALGRYEFDPARFAVLTMPVLLLVGSESPRDNYVTDALAGVLANNQIAELQGQAHIAHAMAPQMFVEVVSTFLLPE
jgi:pimeloyl-ACP methyl ester carboxylesterase